MERLYHYGVPLIGVFLPIASSEIPGVTYIPNFSPKLWKVSATTLMPLVLPRAGNLDESVTQRPKGPTLGSCLPGHWYQQSSRFTQGVI